jgi:hypothetical protein
VDGDALDSLPRCASVGFSVHANVSIAARDRLRLERLARYASRSAVSTERLSELPDGRLLYRLKRRWRNGTTEVVFEKSDFILQTRSASVRSPRSPPNLSRRPWARGQMARSGYPFSGRAVGSVRPRFRPARIDRARSKGPRRRHERKIIPGRSF